MPLVVNRITISFHPTSFSLPSSFCSRAIAHTSAWLSASGDSTVDGTQSYLTIIVNTPWTHEPTPSNSIIYLRTYL